jgi:hypothetical protein
MAETNAFTRALTSLAAERRGDGHPGLDLLLAYHEQRLAAAEREALQEHIAVCPTCVRAVVDMASFHDLRPSADDEQMDDSEVELEMARLRRRIEDLSPFGADDGHSAWRTPDRRSWSGGRIPLFLLAAVFAVGWLGFGLWFVFQESRIVLLKQRISLLENELNRGPGRDHSFEIISLLPIGNSSTRGGEVTVPPSVVGDHASLSVVLNFYAQERALYEAELVGADGEILRSWQPLQRTSNKNFTLSLAPSLLRPGTYQIRLYRLSPGGHRRTAEAQFRFRVGN